MRPPNSDMSFLRCGWVECNGHGHDVSAWPSRRRARLGAAPEADINRSTGREEDDPSILFTGGRSRRPRFVLEVNAPLLRRGCCQTQSDQREQDHQREERS